MHDVFPKFIIEEGNLIISRVTFHREAASDISLVSGGGWFHMSEDKTSIRLYGESEQFGKATLEECQKAVSEGNVYTNYMCTHSIANKFKITYDTGSELIPLN